MSKICLQGLVYRIVDSHPIPFDNPKTTLSTDSCLVGVVLSQTGDQASSKATFPQKHTPTSEAGATGHPHSVVGPAAEPRAAAAMVFVLVLGDL